MTKSRKLISLVLTLALAVMLVAVPVSAANNDQQYTKGGDYKTVFVHGYFGWGNYDSLSKILTYFGLMSGRINDYLNDLGYDTYTASCGPYSSNWDRACEIYAQLTGTRVDYGIAHSKEHGHARFGVDYSNNPLIPNFEWNATNKINLIGHSFGGPTIRTLLDMLADGRPAEVAAAKAAGEKPSELFTGGKKDWVFSLTSIAGVNNGTTFCEAGLVESLATLVTDVLVKVFGALQVSDLKGIYNPDLEQFNIEADPNETIIENIQRVLTDVDFLSHNDHILNDMTIDKQVYDNASIEMQKNVYYFDYYGTRTVETPMGINVPTPRCFIPLAITSAILGAWSGESRGYFTTGYGEYEKTISTPVQTLTGYEWHASDGMVNVASGYCPYHLDANGNRVYDAHVDNYQTGDAVKPGQWYIAPEQDFDHIGIMGGMLNEDPSQIKDFYLNLMKNIDNCPMDSSAAPAGNTVNGFKDVLSTAWYADAVKFVSDKGIMNGTAADSFAPQSNMTRAMLVQTLYAMQGKPAGSPNAGFKDVSGSAWYADAVNWAKANNVVGGYPDGTFRPNDNITREQLAVMLKAYSGDNSKGADISKFADAGDVSGWAKEGVEWAVGTGLIAGRDGNRLAPKANATRAEVAQILKNYCEKVAK
jgi:triacylglycerol esterase/lipase EstA (alpha/beta hydrolase family)